MKWIFTLIMLLLVLNLTAQIKVDNIKPISPTSNDKPVQFRTTCMASINTSYKPLVIIDGKIGKSLSNLDPSIVEKITVLKNADATAAYGSRAKHGVIIITTKNSLFREFVIRDTVDKQPIPSATVTFIPEKNSADSLMVMADKDGKINTDKLQPGTCYLVRISSAGYIAYTTPYINKSNQPKIFNLTRDLVENAPVIVIAYGHTVRCYFICCGGSRVNKSKSVPPTEVPPTEVANSSFRFYPNPVTRGSAIKIEWDDMKSSQLQARVIGLDGRLLFTSSYSSVEGKNILSLSTESRWANGTYFVQIIDESGKIIKQEKILIQ